jgi:tRNA(Ile2)-agmatinylcytidine synthase
MRCIIGIDDTDSQFGRCTTHLGFQIMQALAKDECVFDTYPRLVRLNPNVPFKTRGNAAVCIEFECEDADRAFQTAHSLLLENSDVENGANSGLVFLDGPPPEYFNKLYSTAISGLANYRNVLGYLRREEVRYAILGNGMGVVGAAASIGFRKEDDHTYELIAYRTPRTCGTPRVVDSNSVIEMEKKTFPHAFNSYDHESRRVLITPHGPDPVFLGIRADSPEVTLQAFALVRYAEELEGHVVYLSNQCTDAHLSRRLSLVLKAYHSGWLEGSVKEVERGEGGHFYLERESGAKQVRCAVYEPSGDLCKIAGLLAVGDEIRVFGGVRRATTKHGPVINVEKIELLSAPPSIRSENPTCGNCNTRMKSEGTGKGFQCRTCGAKKGNGSRSVVRHGRTLVPGIYLPSAGGQRHLTKQLIRYGSELSTIHPLLEGWLVANHHGQLQWRAISLKRK